MHSARFSVPRQLHRAAHGVDRLRLDDAVDPRRVELRVDVVDDDALGLRLGLGLGPFVLGPRGVGQAAARPVNPRNFLRLTIRLPRLS